MSNGKKIVRIFISRQLKSLNRKSFEILFENYCAKWHFTVLETSPVYSRVDYCTKIPIGLSVIIWKLRVIVWKSKKTNFGNLSIKCENFLNISEIFPQKLIEIRKINFEDKIFKKNKIALNVVENIDESLAQYYKYKKINFLFS